MGVRPQIARPISLLVLTLTCVLWTLPGTAPAASVTLDLEESAYIHNPTNPADSRVLLRFAFRQELRGTRIDLATLRLTASTGNTGLVPEVVTEAFATTRAWSSGTTTWDQGWQSGDGAWATHVGASFDIVPGGAERAAVDITGVAQYWVDNLEHAGSLVLVPTVHEAGHIASISGAATQVVVFYSGPKRE
jgi:hypothetical protein